MMKVPKIWLIIPRVHYSQGFLYRENLKGVCGAECKEPDIQDVMYWDPTVFYYLCN